MKPHLGVETREYVCEAIYFVNVLWNIIDHPATSVLGCSIRVYCQVLLYLYITKVNSIIAYYRKPIVFAKESTVLILVQHFFDN